MAIATIIAGLITLTAVITVFLVNYISPKFDPREPPVLKPTIPLVGHIIGMLTEGPAYFIRINKKNNHPIYSLPMLNGKAYVVASPTLAVAVQRAASTLSFEQLVADFSPRLVGCSQSTFDILRDPKAKEEGRVRLVSRAHQMINPSLGMNQINTIADSQFKNFTHVISQIQDGDEIELYRYLRRAILDGTTSTFFGPHNPWAVNPELNDKYWDWDDGLIGYTVGILPKITARKAYLGAEACVQGFMKYMEEGHYRDAHPMLQGRKKTHEDYGIVGSEHARMELALTFGFVTNASITTCWVANNIYSRPELLQEIREEIDSNAVEMPGVISGMKLRDACPLFNSVLRETLRLIAPMTSARAVLEDTLLADTYLLKKGNIVQISGSILHADADIWGSDASSFNPRRFIHSMNGSKTNIDGSVPDDKANLAHPAAFRAFGGGSSLCPGRHFAQMEILGLAALLLVEFDMAPPAGLDKVQWDPPKADKKFPINVMKPTRELRVKLRKRSGQDNFKWTLKM